MTGKPNRRGWGWIRRLPNKSRRHQAPYVGPDLKRHYAPHTFTLKTDAERWLALAQIVCPLLIATSVLMT